MRRILAGLVLALLIVSPVSADPGPHSDQCVNLPGIQRHIPNGYEQVWLDPGVGQPYCVPA